MGRLRCGVGVSEGRPPLRAPVVYLGYLPVFSRDVAFRLNAPFDMVTEKITECRGAKNSV